MVRATAAVVGQGIKFDAKLLLGKWTPDEAGKRDKKFVEFAKDGKLAVSFDVGGGKEVKFRGTYKLEGGKLSVKVDFAGTEKTRVRTVDALTQKELVTTDEMGKMDTLVFRHM